MHIRLKEINLFISLLEEKIKQGHEKEQHEAMLNRLKELRAKERKKR
jgi:hypothetical protein